MKLNLTFDATVDVERAILEQKSQIGAGVFFPAKDTCLQCGLSHTSVH
jgi:hypothetical protein